MRPGCGAPLLIGLVVVVALSGQAGAQAKKPELQHLPPASHTTLPPVPAISCDVSAASVSAGQSVEVTTRLLQGDAAGLKYTFETSAGKLTVTGANASTARLDTAGVVGGGQCYVRGGGCIWTKGFLWQDDSSGQRKYCGRIVASTLASRCEGPSEG